MINTHHTSLAPPPVPPRLSRSTPVFIPTPLPSAGHSKPLIRFLVGVVVLHLLLSVGGFIYLYYNEKKERTPTAEGQAGFSAVEQRGATEALASMTVDRQTAEMPKMGYLIWDMDHSIFKNINYYKKSWLTILQPGEYYVYSSVTFSKSDSAPPLATRVMLRNSATGDGTIVMQSFCSLYSSREKPSIPHLCTASQGKVVKLDKGDQLSVWVQNLSLVDYGDRATNFGMYKL